MTENFYVHKTKKFFAVVVVDILVLKHLHKGKLIKFIILEEEKKFRIPKLKNEKMFRRTLILLFFFLMKMFVFYWIFIAKFFVVRFSITDVGCMSYIQ